MTTQALFPTLIYHAPLQRSGALAFNRQLLRDCEQLRYDDVAGIKWSAKNYPGGYTSYGSQCKLHQLMPAFVQLEKKLRRHVNAYAKSLELDLTNRELCMTDCWINVMPQHVVHSLHLHPLSTISGTYYVSTPKGCAGLKLEDPRLDRFMAAPPRKADCSANMRPWFTVPAEAGKVVLFESWLRHEVPPNLKPAERISVSFNYSWF
jgi:uncharacterized protein (TIGR02466 family)